MSSPGCLRDLREKLPERVDLDEWALGSYEKSGHTRWQAILHFYSIDAVKAGFIVKKRGVWYLTEEGEAALKLGEKGLIEAAQTAYRKWRRAQEDAEPTPDDDTPDDSSMTLEEIEGIALDGIKNHIVAMNPYEFQDLVAALLRGMGYHTPFVAPRGKDGGIDIIAYRDPLGTETPRMKVQVKHREQTAGVKEIRELMGVLNRESEIGIFVSRGGFSSDAKVTVRESHVHIELIDLDRLINLWSDYYEKMADEDRQLLPLVAVRFVAPSD